MKPIFSESVCACCVPTRSLIAKLLLIIASFLFKTLGLFPKFYRLVYQFTADITTEKLLFYVNRDLSIISLVERLYTTSLQPL